MKNSRTIPRIYLFVFLIVICMLGLIQGATIISSSRSVNQNVPDVANQSSVAKVKAERSYQNRMAPPLAEMKELFLQDAPGKIAPEVHAPARLIQPPICFIGNTVVKDPSLPPCPPPLPQFAVLFPNSGQSGVGTVRRNGGDGLQSLQLPAASNVIVTISPFTPGTYNPVTVTYTVINPALCVDFTLRARSSFCGIFIRVQR